VTPEAAARPEPPTVAVDILVEAGDWPSGEELKRIATGAVAAAIAAARPEVVMPAEVSFVFTDDRRMRLLNRHFRGVDSATDVLSLPGAPLGPGRYGPLLGDIALARETIVNAAVEDGLTVDDHLTHLIVHGLLHLVGYDHVDNGEAQVMERLETVILASLGIADPYGSDPRQSMPDQ
jgi:probable rRNA maturation factor